MSPGVKPEHVAFYVDLFKKVMATDDWKKFMEEGAFNQTFMTGDEFKNWVEANDKLHYDLMKEAGFLAPASKRDGGAGDVGRAAPLAATHARRTSDKDADMHRRRRRRRRAGRWSSNRRWTSSSPCCCWAVCGIVIYDSIAARLRLARGRRAGARLLPVLGRGDPGRLQPGQPGQRAARAAAPARSSCRCGPFGRVLAVLIPSLVYVALIGGISLGPVDVPGSASTWPRPSSSSPS